MYVCRGPPGTTWRTHVQSHTLTHTRSHTLAHTRTHSYTLAHTRTHLHTPAHTPHTHTLAYTCTHIHTHARTHTDTRPRTVSNNNFSCIYAVQRSSCLPRFELVSGELAKVCSSELQWTGDDPFCVGGFSSIYIVLYHLKFHLLRELLLLLRQVYGIICPVLSRINVAFLLELYVKQR